MNDITTSSTSPPKAPLPATRREADTLAVFRSRIRREYDAAPWSITESDAPKGGDLVTLQTRLAALDCRPEPPTPERARWIVAVVSRLFLRWHVAARASQDQVEAYARDLEPFPNWAIAHGIARIIDGLVLKQPEYPPSSIVIRDAVRAVMVPRIEEASLIRSVLAATIVPDAAPLAVEARKAIAEAACAAMRRPVAYREPQQVPSPQPTPSGAFGAARTIDPGPIRLSDEVLATFGIRPQHDGVIS